MHCPPEKRGELNDITQVFRGSVVDVAPRSVVIQLTGPEEKIEAFIELCRPYGIKQLSRTGLIAMPRASQASESPAGVTPRKKRERVAAAGTPEAAPLPPS